LRPDVDADSTARRDAMRGADQEQPMTAAGIEDDG
jgi:hypothetical protein